MVVAKILNSQYLLMCNPYPKSIILFEFKQCYGCAFYFTFN